MFDDRDRDTASLTRAGRADDEQRGSEDVQVQAKIADNPVVAPVIGYNFPQSYLPSEQIVYCEPRLRQIALLGRVNQRSAVLPRDRVGETLQLGRVMPRTRNAVGDPRSIHITEIGTSREFVQMVGEFGV